MSDIIKAKQKLRNENATLAACRGDEFYISFKSGIQPMVEALTEKIDLSGFSVADKVVGRAAAMLFSLAGIKEVYADLISDDAVNYLEDKKIPVSFSKKVERIINRTKTGLCPMEEAVLGVYDENLALEKIKDKLSSLKKNG